MALHKQSILIKKTGYSLILALVSLGLLLSHPQPARACMCNWGTPSEDFVIHDAVFVGTVLWTDYPYDNPLLSPLIQLWPNSGLGPYFYKRHPSDWFMYLRVHRSWKGVQTTGITLRATDDSCSRTLPFGEEFLIYAYEWQGELYVDDCSRTKPVSSGTDDLMYLQTIPEIKLASDGFFFTALLIITMASIGIILALGWWIWQRKMKGEQETPILE